MKGALIALLVLLVLWLIGQIRLGARLEYSAQGFFLWLRVGAFRIRLLPAAEKGKRKKERGSGRRARRKEQEKDAPSRGGPLKTVQQLLPVILDTVRRLRRKLRVDLLRMELTMAAADPADAAVRYGQANALLGAIWQPVTQVFHVRDGRAHIGVDFDASGPVIYILASLSLTIGQALSLGMRFGIGAIRARLRSGRSEHEGNEGKVVKSDGTETSAQ